ncbi:E3 ubiquitin-protein ligase Topors-like [Anser cygnoides]|uniref:E3 ubiquitin-protein ligase Topors-like n=1 Tax=Anser cygnoides TaxID=8845 RepID=UPI0034D3210E
MATEEAWTCPVCREGRKDVAYATPCNHRFCLGCIQRWAKLKASCPLCRTGMRTIKVSVRGEEDYLECIVSPPAVPVPVGFQAGSATAPHSPAAPAASSVPAEERDAEPDPRAAVGGLLPEDWAVLFRERRDILNPVLPWLRREISAIYGTRWWQARAAESFLLHSLCVMGLDRDAIIQHTQPALGPLTVPLIDGLVGTIVGLCGEEARRLLGLESGHTAGVQEDSPADASGPTASMQGTISTSPAPSNSNAGPDMEELPSTSSAFQHGGPGEVPAAANPQEQEEPREELGQEAAAGPSARACRRRPSTPHRSTRGSRRPRKRTRASSAQDSPQPCKRPLPRRF